MALLSTLVNVIAEVEDMDETYVSGVARYLREGGLISQAGRGRGAAHMSVRDATNLLIGANGSATAKASPETVDAFRSLACSCSQVTGAEVLAPSLKTGALFGDFLERLIRAAMPVQDGHVPLSWHLLLQSDVVTGKTADQMAKREEQALADFHSIVSSEITFNRPRLSASVDIRYTGAAGPHDPPYAPAPHGDPQRGQIVLARFAPRKASRSQGDRRDGTAITLKTILALGTALAS
jgi:hypothetical protein